MVFYSDPLRGAFLRLHFSRNRVESHGQSLGLYSFFEIKRNNYHATQSATSFRSTKSATFISQTMRTVSWRPAQPYETLGRFLHLCSMECSQWMYIEVLYQVLKSWLYLLISLYPRSQVLQLCNAAAPKVRSLCFSSPHCANHRFSYRELPLPKYLFTKMWHTFPSL